MIRDCASRTEKSVGAPASLDGEAAITERVHRDRDRGLQRKRDKEGKRTEKGGGS